MNGLFPGAGSSQSGDIRVHLERGVQPGGQDANQNVKPWDSEQRSNALVPCPSLVRMRSGIET
jgi:hypothetical protein